MREFFIDSLTWATLALGYLMFAGIGWGIIEFILWFVSLI